jgi:hypothetical protein
MKIEYKDNIYKLQFDITSNMLFEKLLNIHFFDLFFDVNKNVIEDKNIQNIELNKYYIYLKLTHFFKELGITQKCVNLELMHNMKENAFIINTNENIIVNENIELLHINALIKYKKITDNIYLFDVIIENEELDIEDMGIEKLVGKIIIKIFNNLKEYIEKNIL